MPAIHQPAPAAADLLLRILRVGNLAFAGMIATCLVGSYVFEAAVVEYVASSANGLAPMALLQGLRLLAVVGILSCPLVHVLLTQLLAIVDTVRTRDPFVHENAARLKRIAWLLLGVEVLHLGVGGMARWLSATNVEIEWTFSFTGWVAVVLLFTLAHVFENGARMRQDLQGTV